MTEPLINQDGIAAAIKGTRSLSDQFAAYHVVEYLRSVLTPEALDQPRDPDGLYKGDVIVTGYGMYRRIFGEDK